MGTAQNINLIYKDTKANIEALPVYEGFLSYALDTGELGYHNGTSWVWIASGNLTQEQIEDFVGAMFSGNTETRITATYNDGTGKINLEAASIPEEVLASPQTATFATTDILPILNGITLKFIEGDDFRDAMYAMMETLIGVDFLAVNSLSNFIKGLQMKWNSGTSLTVGSGLVFINNDQKIYAVTNPITKSSLSLSNNTWYHVYAFVSDGSIDIEITTPSAICFFCIMMIRPLVMMVCSRSQSSR